MTLRRCRVVLIALAGSFCVARAAAQETREPAREETPAASVEPAAETPPSAAPEAPAAPAESAAPSVQLLSEDELSALGLDSSAPAVDLSLKLSGFADFGFSAFFGPENSLWRALGAVPARPTFYVGNVNLYLQKRLTETISTMAEIRFSFLPNGSGGFGFEERQDTTASDYTDFGRTTRWGSIILQRIYVEWQPDVLFAVRGGQFLTPYGVWNVDHGSPVVIPARRPWVVGVGWIPEKQTGLEFLGRARLSANNVLGYHLTLSNGVGPISEYADLDNNKAIGGRVYWEYQGLGRMRLGVSGYYGRVTDATFSVLLTGTAPSSEEVIASQFDSLSWAGDFTWDLGDLHLQTEWIANQQAYTEEGRAATERFGRLIIPSDVFSWGGYGLAGYRLPWFGIMPFVLLERVVGDLSNSEIKQTTYQGGLNIRPVDELVFKVCFEYVDFDSETLEPIKNLMTQVAWAF